MINKNNLGNNISRGDRWNGLRMLQKNIFLRVALVVLTIALIAVLLFSLTAAWYTNVVQSGGLTFQAEKWSFDGQVTISNHSISAAPGDEGVVALSLKNNSDHTIAASVTVSKEEMSKEMKQRLYFFVEVPETRNGEKMSRTWISANSSYTYSVFPNSEMNLNEEFTKGPLLKWMWTYDVLGYYVRGKQNGSGVVVEEYIRPIEYEYDPAKTTFQGGKLATVDGTKKVSDFLKELTANDGYLGVVDETVSPIGNGYYPVEVDYNGSGIWIYLCNYSEIQVNQNYDAMLAANGNLESCSAKVIVTGWNSREDAVIVSSEEEFYSAINDSYSPMVKLTGDLTLTQSLVMSTGKNVLIDLNNHTLTSSAAIAMHVTEGATVVLQNGSLQGDSNPKQAGIVSRGGHVTLNHVTISGMEHCGVRIDDDLSKTKEGSVVHITDCTFTGNQNGCGVYGVSQPDKSTSVVIERSRIEGANMGLYGNGSSWGTDIRIVDSTIVGGVVGIYHPEKDSTLTLENCIVTGTNGNGINVKGGTVNIMDCIISGHGAPNEPAYSEGGSTLTGDGVYLEANYQWNSSVTISGDKTQITSEHACAVRQYQESDANASILILGGTFNTDVSQYLSEDLVLKPTEEGLYSVSPE